jgi:hypothetical protein
VGYEFLVNIASSYPAQQGVMSRRLLGRIELLIGCLSSQVHHWKYIAKKEQALRLVRPAGDPAINPSVKRVLVAFG